MSGKTFCVAFYHSDCTVFNTHNDCDFVFSHGAQSCQVLVEEQFSK